MGSESCDTNIECLSPTSQPQETTSLQKILGQLAGYLSQSYNGKDDGTTISPAPNITINVTVIQANGGGATMNYTDRRRPPR